MEDRRLPDREQLLRLRRQGLVPWSRSATRCAVTAATCLVLMWLLKGNLEIGDRLGLSGEEHAMPRVAGTALLVVVIATAVGHLSMGLLFSLLQTRFLIAPKLLRPRFDRSEYSIRPAAQCAGLVMGLAIGAYVSYRLLPDLFVLLRRGEGNISADVGSIAQALAGVIVLVTVVLAILSAVLKRYLFRWDNRFTRSEWSSLAGED